MNIKKLIGLLLLIPLSVSCSRGYNAGTYEAVGKGRNGDIRVSVVIDSDGKITNIEVLENSENNRMMKQVTEGMIPNMKKDNTSEVDSISGATESSIGFKEAVRNALKDAR